MKKFKKLISFALALALVVTLVPANVTKAADTAPIGIDVSWEEGLIDWSEASEVVDFAVIRAVEGTVVDDEFLNNVEGCIANEVPFGVSVYTLAQTADEAVAEAEIALELLDGYTPTLPIYMEFEDADLYALSDEEKMAVVNAFASTVEEAGYVAGLYVTMDTYNAYFAEKVDALKIWVSDLDATSLPLEGADMWQYSWDGQVAGVDGDASMNYYYGDKIQPEEPEHVCTPVVDEAVPPTCTATGLTEGSHCGECGEVIKAQEVVPALGHTPKTVEGKLPTCTDTGLTEGSVCGVCGEELTAQGVVDALGHTAGEEVHENVIDGVSYDKVVRCSVCKEEISRETVALTNAGMKFSNFTLKLENDISGIFDSKTVGTLTDPYIIVVQELKDGETKTTRVEGEWDASAKKYVFMYQGIEAKQVGDKLSATIYAHDENGYVVKGGSTSSSAKAYCDYMIDYYLNKSGTRNQALVTLLVDLLNYSAEAQKYHGYKTDALVNADLTEAEKAKASADSVIEILDNITNAKYETIENPTVSYNAATITLLNKVFVNIEMLYSGEMDNVKAIFTVGGVDYEVTEFTKLSNVSGKPRYKFTFDNVTAFQLEEPIYVKFVDGDTVISNTLQYSVESYAAYYRDNAKVGAVVCAMMKYGKAAYAYKYAK